MGGGAALGFALNHPDRVEKLALVDSYGLGERIPGGSLGSLLGALFVRTPWLTGGIWDVMGSSRELARLVLTGVVGAGNLTDELVDDVFAELQRPNAGEAWQRFQRNEVGFSGLKTNYRRRLPELSVPTLLVHGEDDALVPVGWAVRAGTLAPSASVEVLRDCGHWPPREKSERFNSVVREFLGTA